MADLLPRQAEAPPPGVAERLEQLRALFVPESDTEVRRRLATQTPAHVEPFAASVARRLDELRALCELADYVHPRQGLPPA